MKIAFFVLALSGETALSAVAARSVPAGCDPAVMSETYWRVWNDDEQAQIDADIERNRKTDCEVKIGGEGEEAVPVGTVVTVDGKAPVWRDGEDVVDILRLYPGSTEAGADGSRWAEVATRAGSSGQWFAGLFLPGGSELGVK